MRVSLALIACLTSIAPAPAHSQDSTAVYIDYARALLEAEQGADVNALEGLPDRLALIAPAPGLDSLHVALRDRATRWAKVARRAEPVPTRGVTPCLGRNPSASSDCTGSNVRQDVGYQRARNDAAVASNQYAMVRRELIRRLTAAGVRFQDRHAHQLATSDQPSN